MRFQFVVLIENEIIINRLFCILNLIYSGNSARCFVVAPKKISFRNEQSCKDYILDKNFKIKIVNLFETFRRIIRLI